MVAALGIAASLLSDIGFKALKGLSSGHKGAKTTQEGITDPSSLAGQFVPGKGAQASMSKLIAPFDTDGDGKLSKDEFLALKTKIDSSMSVLLKTQENTGSSAAQAASNTAAPADQLFAKLDANGDGSITPGEIAKAFGKAHHHHHHDASGQGVSQASADGSSATGGNGKDADGIAAFLSALMNLQSQSGTGSTATSSASTSGTTA